MEGDETGGSKPAFATPNSGNTEPSPKKEADFADEARIIEEVVIPASGSGKKPEGTQGPISTSVPTPAPETLAVRRNSPEVDNAIPKPTPQKIEPTPAAATPTEGRPPLSGILGGSKSDIGKMLKEVKITERLPLPDAVGEQKPKVMYDTSLANSLSNAAEEKGGRTAVMNALEATTPTQNNPQTIQEGTASSIVRPLHTLKDDFQDIVRDKKISLVRAAALELDKKRDEDQSKLEVSKSGNRHMFRIVFAAILLASLGSAAFFGVALIMNEREGGPATLPETSLLFAEAALPLHLENLSTFALKELLAQARSPNSTILGSIRQIVPTLQEIGGVEDAPRERPATLEEFFSALDTHTPPDLLRALSPDFFFGIHTVDENAPLFVIPVSSYERAFAGMLEWEGTMNADLAPIFTRVPDTKMNLGGALEKRRFEDLVMRNYDVRALKDETGTIQLYYSFPTRALLIIAESPYSFAEILSRLRAERKL